MESLSGFFSWIGENEAVLSGIAAVIAIAAVLRAVSSRTFGWFRTKNVNTDTPVESAASTKLPQEVRYCRVGNGTRVAWSSA